VTGAGAVVALVLIEWTAGLAGAASWTQSWSVVRRGHFRIVAWSTVIFGVLALLANGAGSSAEGIDAELQRSLVWGLALAGGLYVASQYARSDIVGTIAGGLVAAAGVLALLLSGSLIDGSDQLAAFAHLVAGALLLGAVTNGMLLGHWYLNQPGLKPWALGRLTTLALLATAVSGVLGLLSVEPLATASTEGAVLGLPGFGEDFGAVFFLIWVALLGFTGAVVWMARRCVKIRSIQSATGLYYVALLTAGVSEFLVRYLMVNAT
jgi:hypothetical protein